MPKCKICGKFRFFNIDKIKLICKKCNAKKERHESGASLNAVGLSIPNKSIEPYIQDPFANIPKEIIDLIWFLDGARKNFVPQVYNISKTFNGQKMQITVSSSFSIEPSAISINLPISTSEYINTIENLGYFPSYETMTPDQRTVYLSYLNDIYNPTYDIGYVFTFYYGLERHLFQGNFDKAFQMILKLRSVHKNKSFQQYTLTALFSNCIIHQRFDLLSELRTALIEDSPCLKINLFIYYKTLMKLGFSARDLIRYAYQFGFTNTKFLKKNCSAFEQQLNIELKKNALSPPLGNLPDEEIHVFANWSIPLTIKIPNYISIDEFKSAGYGLLQNAYEKTKTIIKNKEKS